MSNPVRTVAATAALCLAGALSGCGAVPAATSPIATPTVAPPVVTPSAAAEAPQIYAEGPLEPGWYRTSQFLPAFAFRVDGDGWRALFADDADEFAIDLNGREPLVAIARPAKVIDPMTGVAADAPDDLVAWFVAHPRLNAEEVDDRTSLAGQAVRTVEFGNPGTVDIPIFSFPSGDFRAPPGTTQRSYVAAMDGPDLVVTVVTEGTSAEDQQRVARVLDSLQLLARD